MTQPFTLVIERGHKSRWLVGKVAELPGCYTQAQNMDELERSIREAIQVNIVT